MIEGQEGVTWEQWQALAAACEKHGYEALFRSDHYLSVMGSAERGSLDAWTTLAALAAVTSRLRLGTLVSPATFRHPSVLAKSVRHGGPGVGGRVEVGIGAGWLEAEHRTYGFPFAPLRTRMDVMAEQMEIVARSFADERFSFQGRALRDRGPRRAAQAAAAPAPADHRGRQRRPAKPRTGRAAGRTSTTPSAHRWTRSAQRRDAFAVAWQEAGRDADAFRFSAMVGILVGADEAELRERAARLAEWQGREPWRCSTACAPPGVAGTVDEAAERLRELEAAGAQRVMLQHLLHEDVEAVELIGRELVPQLA